MVNTANPPTSTLLNTPTIKQGDGLAVRLRKLRTHGDGLDVHLRKPQAFLSSGAVIARARKELEGLIGYDVDNVSGFEKTDAGWRLAFTVVELRRIPATTDVLASYAADLTEAGDVVSYHRDARYLRNQVGGEA